MRCRCFSAGNAGGLFPPLKTFIHQSDSTHSFGLLQKISWAGANCSSYEQAARALEVLTAIKITPCQIARITQQVGQDISSFEHGREETHEKIPTSSVAAVVSVDGGRVQTRAEDQPAGVHLPQWKETKVAHLQLMESKTQSEDPHPEIPTIFVDPHHVTALVGQLSSTARATQTKEKISLPSKPKEHQKEKEKVLVKSCLASVTSAETFAPWVRNEALRLGMETCQRKAFLGDGGASNWLIHEKFFAHWYATLDFVHLVEHLFMAANAIYKQSQSAWNFYEKTIKAAWEGKPQKILALLRNEQNRIGTAEKKLSENDAKCILHRAIHYIQDNQNRMQYPLMRKLGLPISSCRVESLIKQINQRVKASDKFWIIPNVNAVLSVRAAELSTTGKWNRFWRLKMAA